MQKSAKIVLTSYDLPKINDAIKTIRLTASDLKIKAGSPRSLKVKKNPDQPIWGCDASDLKRKAIPIKASTKNLKKFTKIKMPTGVVLQVSLQ